MNELHICTSKDSSTVGFQLVLNTNDKLSLIDHGEINVDGDKESAIEYTIDKLASSYGACDVFLNGATIKLI